MTTSYSKCLFAVLFCLISGISSAQNDLSIYAEPEFSLNLDTPNRWSFNFGIGNRNLVLENAKGKFDARHLELSHFTSYEVGFYSKLSLGLRYRFREMFEDSQHDEIRITQQYGRSKKFDLIKIAHRVRFEQRFREDTGFRSRYEFSVEFPLNGTRIDRNEFFMVTDTEALWSVGKEQKPSFEHRLGISIGNEIFDNTKADVELEYRLDDYNSDPASELFITAGISLSI